MAGASVLAACEPDVPPDPTSKAGQLLLVEGLTPVQPKVRFRRALGEGVPSEVVDEVYDHRGTPAEEESRRVKAEIAANTAGSDWSETYDETRIMRVIYATAGAEYELGYDLAELAELGRLARERGIHHASTSTEEEAASLDAVDAPGKEAQGWSNGIDSRDPKAISVSYPSNHRELRRIGRIDDGCTGVAVGRRLVLTAAHCITNPTLTFTNHDHTARQSNTTTPYGTVTSEGWQIAQQWVDLDCHLFRAAACHQHDWAIVIFPDDVWSGQTHPGWMGYSVAAWGDYFYTARLHENGYPNEWSCYVAQGLTPIESGAPAHMFTLLGAVINSRTDVPYGQTFAGTVRDPMHYVGSHPRLIHFSNDISCGHSGGAIWSDHPGSNGPYVLGINAYERCAGDSCADAAGTTKTHPSGARALTPGLADIIASYRVSHP